jgi:hypothetical protein
VINGDNVGTLVIYDAVTATNTLATIDLTAILGSIDFELDFYDGLTITTTGAGTRITLVYE